MKKKLLLFCSSNYSRINPNILTDGKILFDEVELLNENDLDKDIIKTINDIIRKYDMTGYGYWIWKPYIILQELNKLNDGDILVFLDMHCHLNHLKEKFQDIVNELQIQKVIFGYTGLPERQYSTYELYNYIEKYLNYKFTDEDWNSSQFEAGEVFLNNCEESREFVRLWYDIMKSNISLITNKYDKSALNDSEFIINRNDQSVVSLLYKYKKYKTPEYLTWSFFHNKN